MDCHGLSSAQSLQALAALLSNPEDQDDGNKESCASMGPGHIGPQMKKVQNDNTKMNSKDIWHEEEVSETPVYEDLTDPRPEPKYEIMLKQHVGTEDVILGLSMKDPSSMCCDALLVRINLPGTKATDVILDVKERFLDLRTPKYKLGLPLPYPVHTQEGKAQFFSEKELLEVTLVTDQSSDFM